MAIPVATYPDRVFLLGQISGAALNAALDPVTGNLAGARVKAGTATTITIAGNDVACEDLRQEKKSMLVRKNPQPINRTNQAAAGVMTQAGRVATEVDLELYLSDTTDTLIINNPTGAYLLFHQRQNRDVFCGIFSVTSAEEQGEDDSGDMTYRFTLSSMTPQIPQYIRA